MAHPMSVVPGRRKIVGFNRLMRNMDNFQIAQFDGAGPYGIPILQPETRLARNFIGFHFAMGLKDGKELGIHFFEEDYLFQRIWNSPDAYLDHLAKFECLLTPDFSLYTDFPMAMQIWNHYRKHWLGAYWQECGLKVIPTIAWSNERSFEWCFDGEPEGGIVAVSSVGTQNREDSRRLFLRGYREMKERLHPSAVLFYGNVPKECEADNVVPIRPYQDVMRIRATRERDMI